MARSLPKNVRYVAADRKYRAVMDVAGKRKVGPLRETPKEAADDAAKMRRACRKPLGPGVTLRMCFDALLDELRQDGARPDTETYYRNHWRIVTGDAGWGEDLDVGDLTVDQAHRYATRRVESGIGLSTAWDKEIGTLRRAIKAGLRCGLIRSDPLAGLRRPRIRQGRFAVLTTAKIEEFVRLIRESGQGQARIRERDALIVELFAWTGMRRAEVARLTVADCDFDATRIFVDGKTGDRYLPMTARIKTVLAKLREGKADADLVAANVDTIERIFDRWSDRTGIPVSPHVLRHSFATAAVEAGVDAFRLATLLGHSDIKQTARYFHATAKAQHEAMDAIHRKSGAHGV